MHKSCGTKMKFSCFSRVHTYGIPKEYQTTSKVLGSVSSLSLSISKMVGIFSRLSVRANNHRRTQSALVNNRREELPRASDATNATNIASTASVPIRGFEIAVGFKAIEHPNEPLDSDRPIRCPLPEPSILNDGRIWKERVSSSVQSRGDMTVVQEQASIEPETPRAKPRPRNRGILPSVSAPEHNILKLLEECNTASGISFNS